jgi:replicative DNA helicase
MSKSILDFSDKNAEQLLFGHIFAVHVPERPLLVISLSESIGPEYFTLERHRLVFGAMQSVARRGDPVIPLAIYREIEKHNQHQAVGSFSDFETNSCEIVNLEYYVSRIVEQYRKRKLYAATLDWQKRLELQDETDDVIEGIRGSLGHMEQAAEEEDELDPEQIINNAGGLGALLSPDAVHGITTPWPNFNECLGSFVPGELCVIGGLSSDGKTTLALNIAWHAAKNKHKVRIDQYEMLPKRLLRRIFCMVAQVNSHDVRHGRLGAPERKRLQEAAAEVVSFKKYLKIPTRSPRTPAGILRAHRKAQDRSEPIELQIVDYIQKMKAVGKMERRDMEVSEVTKDLKQIAVDMRTSVLALSQLNVDSKNQFQHAPTLDDFRESRGIGFEMDTGIVLRTLDENQRRYEIRKIYAYFVKQRDDRLGKVLFDFEAKFFHFKEASVNESGGVSES